MRKCTKCGSTSIAYEPMQGHQVCTDCGEVLEENVIVSEVGFSETSSGQKVADGFRVSNDSARARGRGGGQIGGIGANQIESREVTIANGNRRIQGLGTAIKMNDMQVEKAQRYFRIAVELGFTKGRRSHNVAAACLYVICRQDNMSIMLIDFSVLLRVNVYYLGRTYVRLLRILHLDGNERFTAIDPVIYINRFANSLDFEDKVADVVDSANRLVSRMDRDWMVKGRRPAGICAACIFIAARMHGFRRTALEIVRVVRICVATLRKRLQEFQETDSSDLTVNMFDVERIVLEAAHDPPSFRAAEKKKEAAIKQRGVNTSVSPRRRIGSLTDPSSSSSVDAGGAVVLHKASKEAGKDDANDVEDEDGTEALTRGRPRRRSLSNERSDDFGKIRLALEADEFDDVGRELELAGAGAEKYNKAIREAGQLSARSRGGDDDGGDDDDDDSELDRSAAGVGKDAVDVGENLEDLDDDPEVMDCKNSEEEIELKKIYWVSENADWLLKDMEKKKRLASGEGETPKTKRPRKKKEQISTSAATPLEAGRSLVKTTGKMLSKKLNYNVLNNLLEDLPGSPSSAAGGER